MKDSYPLYIKIIFALTGILFFFVILSYGKTVFIPLAISVLFAIVIYPVYKELCQRKLPKVLALIISLTLLFAALAGILTIVIYQFVEFFENIPLFVQRLENIYINIQYYLEEQFDIEPQVQSEYFSQMVGGYMDNGMQGLVGNFINRAGNILVAVGIVPIYTFLFIYYRDLFRDFALKITPKVNEDKIRGLFSKGSRTVQASIGGTVTIIAILTVLNTSALAILGFPFPVFFGVFTAILTVIPYIGPFIGTTITVLYAIIISNTIFLPIMIVVLLNAIQYLEGNFISPKIAGASEPLNPLATLIAIFLGAMVWGIIGILLFIPYLNILRIIMNNFEKTRPLADLIGSKKGQPPADIEYI